MLTGMLANASRIFAPECLILGLFCTKEKRIAVWITFLGILMVNATNQAHLVPPRIRHR